MGHLELRLEGFSEAGQFPNDDFLSPSPFSYAAIKQRNVNVLSRHPKIPPYSETVTKQGHCLGNQTICSSTIL